ncbi:hypothetical protein CBR_g21189 [Chara braunii]|uniref:Integrase catalytic domain-containing protein n=1 Tax=Chara braunii TaxID=69332 RepID=A0A388L0X2_CHABU|nr:hypothetical protein CBR_g21189 [Chara braunii]|eukprot:GBG75947.1 hypothetical protein CBR_g21189 [Chara braunii]
MAVDWQTQAETGKMEENESKIALLLCHLKDLLAMCIVQQEDIHRLSSRIQQLEKRLVVAPIASASNTSDRIHALEIDVGALKDGAQIQRTATQHLEQRICAAAAHPSPVERETTPKWDGQTIFFDSSKTDPIQWFRNFELTLQLHLVSKHKHHTYLYSRSGGACQAWLDNLLSKYGVVAADLHTQISWEDLKAAWHKRFQVKPPEIKAMDKLLTFEQGTLPSGDWITEYQRLTSVPDLQMGFKAIKNYFISRSCPALSNALTHVDEYLTTTAELFDKAAQIIVTNKEAKNLGRSSAAGPGRDQHRPRVVVVAAAMPPDLSYSEAVGLSIQGQRPSGKLSVAKSESTTLLTSSEPVSAHITVLHSKAQAEVDSPPLLHSFEDYAARLVPTLGSHAQGQDRCAVSSPSGSSSLLSSGGSSQDSAREFNIEVLDPLTSEDFAWLPLPTTGCLPGPQCAALCAHLHQYLSFYAPPASLTDDGAAVGDILAYVTKVAREFRTQRYDDNNAPLMYVRIQVGQASSSALLDSDASRNFMSQSFMQRAGLGTQVRRKANPTAIKLADATFQAAMTNEFRAMLDRFVLVYLDDILIYSRTLEDHLGHLRRVLETLGYAKYKANRDKRELVRQELEYLGHFLTPEGISPLSDKIQAIEEWPEPWNVTDVRSFLGLADYYQRFIKGYSKIAAHLTKLQCEDRPFDFGADVQELFLALKAALLSAEVLRIYDPQLPTRVTTDASGYGIGAVLEQHDGVDWHPVEYFNKKVSVVHSIDDARKKELLAFVHALKRDVTRYCESCEVCRRCKSRNHRPYGELRPLSVPLRRREAIAMDITGSFPKHKTSVDGILTVVHRLTKFAMFLPCRYHAKAPELAEVLYADWIRTKGYPEEIVCDRDTRFMSDFWLALIKRWGSSLKPSSARHSQTDGQTERAHQTAQVLLRTLIRPDQKDKVERLPDVELAYNSSIHPAIGMSPFEFENGSPVTSPLDTIIPRAAESDDHLLFLRQMQELLVKARDQMTKTQQRMSLQANRERLPCPFRAGDLVWVSAAEFSLEQDISRKLLPKWMGPWSIVAPARDAPEGPSFIIQVPTHLPAYPVFHCSKLALYTPADHNDFSGRRSQDPPSMDGFQEVSDIISQRRHGNRTTEYLVHFAYSSHRAYRWLTRADLQAIAPDVLAHYERKMQSKPVSSVPRRPRVPVPPSDRQLRPRPGLTS